MKAVFGSICILGLLAAATAQDSVSQSQDPVDKARALYREIIDSRATARKDLEHWKDVAKQHSPKSKERMDAVEKANAAAKGAKAPMTPFVTMFRDLDWKKFDVAKDAELLKEGLAGVARDADNGEKAIGASKVFVELFPTDRVVGAIQSRWLPMALLGLDRDEEAVRELRAEVERSKDAVKAHAARLLGDIESIRGDFEAAKSAYAIVAAAPDKAMGEKAAAIAAVIGKPAPAIASEHWIGGDAIPFADLKGKVALLGFFATWAAPARLAVANWNRMRDENQEAGLVCIGLTRRHPHGYLPADESQNENGGVSRQGMSLEDYLGHLTQYHTNTKTHYPFVVVEDQFFKEYGVLPVPTVVLLDRESRITLVNNSPIEDDDIVRCALRRHLRQK